MEKDTVIVPERHLHLANMAMMRENHLDNGVKRKAYAFP